MPHFTLAISPLGPLLTAFIGVSRERYEALQKEGQTAPGPIKIQALVDTGATGTVIDTGVLAQLGVTPTGRVPVHTPSTSVTAPHEANQFDVSVIIPGATQQTRNHVVPALPVIEAQLAHQGYHALIGRDILASCILVYAGHEGQAGIFTLSY